MIGDLEGSAYQSQKMRMSSYLKQPTLSQPSYQIRNDVIPEEEEDSQIHTQTNNRSN
jgi:hypothetical protein